MGNLEIYSKKLKNCANELLDLINSDVFMAGKYHPKDNEILIKSQDDAVTFACDQDVDRIKGEEYQYWTHILEENARTGEQMDEELRLNLGEEFQKERKKSSNEIVAAINKKAKNITIDDSLVDVICGNFFILLMNRTLLEKQNRLDQQMYAIYQGGGIPCGWKGSFPEGQMLVYSS